MMVVQPKQLFLYTTPNRNTHPGPKQYPSRSVTFVKGNTYFVSLHTIKNVEKRPHFFMWFYVIGNFWKIVESCFWVRARKEFFFQTEHPSRSSTTNRNTHRGLIPFQHIIFIHTLIMHSKNVHRRKSAAAKTLFDLKKSKPTYTYPSFKTDQHEDSMSDIACDYKHRPSTPTSVPPPEAAPTSTPFKDPYFPHIEQNNFQILDTKNINTSLTLAYCGVQRGNSSRLWSLCLGTLSV